MELSFSVNGREALPVRAVPWVVGAEAFTRKILLPPSLIVQIARLACDAKDTIPCSPLLRLYRYDKDRVLPVTSERLDAIAPEHDFQEEADEPLRESTSRLPAGVFVFLDELRRCVDWQYPPGCHDEVCRDLVALNTSPDLPDEMIERLQEGFVAPRPNAAGERSRPRKILFWLAPNEILIPADQVAGTIAETLYPPLLRDGTSNDRNAVERLKAEREHSQKLSEKHPNLPDGYKFSVADLSDYLEGLSLEIDVRHRSPTSVGAAQGTIGWFDATLGAAIWFNLHAVKPQEVAMLLCGFNPHDNKCDPLADSTDETSPDDYKRLLRVLEDISDAGSQPRTLLQWLAIARDKGLKYHSWIDEYENAVALVREGNEQNVSYGAPESDSPQEKQANLSVDHNDSTPPGKLPNVACGRLAVFAAWEIEGKKQRAATQGEVMELMQTWADDGSHPHTLMKSVKDKRAVEWKTKSGKSRIYDIEACGKTLETWMKNRA